MEDSPETQNAPNPIEGRTLVRNSPPPEVCSTDSGSDPPRGNGSHVHVAGVLGYAEMSVLHGPRV